MILGNVVHWESLYSYMTQRLGLLRKFFDGAAKLRHQKLVSDCPY